VDVFTRRNAIVGYVTLKAAGKTFEKKAAKAARRQRKRLGKKRSRLPLYLALGIVSFGILAAVAAYAAKQRSGAAQVAGEAEELAVGAPDEASEATADAGPVDGVAAEAAADEASEAAAAVSESVTTA
jgi:hypothetical protein